ncbi:UDP-N-acetylmuramoyl-tripeptide--D-alanyl-D-alanine ligase [soil metagenome]
MIALTLTEIAATVGGTLLRSERPELMIDGPVETDSRRIVPGGVFFALPGEQTDGHLFAGSAVDNGAAVLIVERELEVDLPQIVVADGVLALAALASQVVSTVRAAGDLRVVGITGSNGKTTTKNMLSAILSAQGETVAPQGSFNNQVGVPLTMLQVTDQTRFLIVEMGASAEGDIARLTAMVMPDISVVLKVGLAHAGQFGGIEATQRAKSEIVASLPPTAVAVLNRDDGRVAAMAGLTEARPVWFGLDDSADVRADNLRPTATGTAFTLHVGGAVHEVRLRLLGEHQVMNALAALAVARELAVAVESAIAALEGIERAERWRMEVLHPAEGVTVINDGYNASPDSTAAALKTLVQIVGPDQRSIAVLGEMNALGDYADEEHDRIGRLVVRLNIHQLIVVGHGARHIHNAAGLEGSWAGESVLVDTMDEAYDLLRDELRPGDVVLVKSSNAAGLRLLGDRLGGVGE